MINRTGAVNLRIFY